MVYRIETRVELLHPLISRHSVLGRDLTIGHCLCCLLLCIVLFKQMFTQLIGHVTLFTPV